MEQTFSDSAGSGRERFVADIHELRPSSIRNNSKWTGADSTRLSYCGLHDFVSRNSYFGYLTSLPAGNAVMEKQLSWFFFFSPMSFANQTSWKLCAPQASQQTLAQMQRSSPNELFAEQAVAQQRAKILFLAKFFHFNTCWCKNGKPRTRSPAASNGQLSADDAGQTQNDRTRKVWDAATQRDGVGQWGRETSGLNAVEK